MIWSRPELRVLFVCTANICRSPMAEGLLRHRLRGIGLAGRIQVRSAGTRVAQSGCPPDPRVKQMSAEAGFRLGRIRSRQLTPQMVQRSDYVLVMEREHLESVRQLGAGLPGVGEVFQNRTSQNSDSQNSDSQDNVFPEKVQLLGRFLVPPGASNGEVAEIPDPYFGHQQGFQVVYERIDEALTGFISCLVSQL